jgi:transcription termination factor Rho
MTVLQREELEQSPLADLHAIASELGLDGFRSKRKADLIGAILDAQGGEEAEGEAGEPAPDEPASTRPLDVADSAEAAPDEPEPDEVPSAESLEGPPAGEDEVEAEAPEGELDIVEEEPEVEEEEEPSDEEILTGPLDILANGSGFLRLDPAGQSRGDVYVSPAQIRRCELRSGDEISGPVRPPRRNERHPSLIRVESVNGADAEPPEQRPWFGELTPIFPTETLGELRGVSYGKGARVAIVGPPGAGATTLLREAVGALGDDLFVQIALAGVRPEEIAAWRELGPPVVGGSFERSPEAQAQAAELAVERAKRQVERGGHAVLVVDSLYALPPGTRRRVFGAGRATEEGGTLTVLAAGGDDHELLRWATARVELPPPT